MSYLVLLIDLFALGLVAVAPFQAVRLASIAAKILLRRAWLAVAGLLIAVLTLGTYTTFDRFLSGVINSSVTMTAVVNLLGAMIIFAAVLLSRMTADDVLKVAELELAAYTDMLTGLPNRRSFDHALPTQVEIARRRGQPLVLIMLDIDRFKRVNDENGHEWGDRVLAHLGRLLTAHKRKSDIAYRIGGEEFAVLAPQTTVAQGRAVAERLRQAIENCPLVAEERRTAITVSFGVAMLRPDDEGSLLANRADEALYRAKRTGRNRVCSEDDPAVPAEASSEA